MAKKMDKLGMTAWVLCTIAALQLGLVGAFGLDVLGMLGGTITKLVYIIIGISGLYSVWQLFTCKK